MRSVIPAVISAAIAIGLGGLAHAGAAPEEAIATLQKRGYTAIEIVPDETPGYQARACKGGTRFEVTMDRETNIIDVDPRGSCGGGQRDYAAAPPPEPIVPHGYKGEHYAQGNGGPAVAHGYLLDRLHALGYYNIRVIDVDDDEIEVLACKKGRLYELEIELDGRIDDIDKKGRCKGRRYGKRIEAPFTGVDTRHGRVDVEAPFTGVRVGERGVHIRAPFVDFTVPR